MTTTPEPVEWHLARIEALAELYATAPICEHCLSWHEPLGETEAGGLVRAVGLRHEPDCPVLAVAESQPAAEYDVSDFKLE